MLVRQMLEKRNKKKVCLGSVSEDMCPVAEIQKVSFAEKEVR